MKIQCIPVGMLHTNCYIVTDEQTNRCAVVDPGANSQKVLDAVRENGAQVDYVLLTHGHFDHVMAAPAVVRETGAKLMIHKRDESWLAPEYAARPGYIREEYVQPAVAAYLEDGAEISLGALTVRVMHTPGHTKGSCVLLVGDTMISGDTLFQESCGRCDLEGGNIDEMMGSLKKLAMLPGDYTVLPGHDVSTTLAHERAHNPYMRQALRQ